MFIPCWTSAVRYLAAVALLLLTACDLSPVPQPNTPTPVAESTRQPTDDGVRPAPDPPLATATSETLAPTPNTQPLSLAWDHAVEGVILGGPAADERTVY